MKAIHIILFFAFLFSGNSKAKSQNSSTPLKLLTASLTGEWIAGVSNSYDIKIWHGSSGGEFKKLEGHGGFVQALAFSPDGKYLASGDLNGDIRLWLVKTGELKRRFVGSRITAINAIAFSTDGRMLAAAGNGEAWYIFDEATQEVIAENPPPLAILSKKRPITCLTFSPDNKTLVLGSTYEVILIDLAAKKERLRQGIFSEQTGEIKAVAFSTDGRFLAIGGGYVGIQLSIYELPKWYSVCTSPSQFMNFGEIYWFEWTPAKGEARQVFQWEPLNKRLTSYDFPSGGPEIGGRIVFGEHGGGGRCIGVLIKSTHPIRFDPDPNWATLLSLNRSIYAGYKDGSLKKLGITAPKMPLTAGSDEDYYLSGAQFESPLQQNSLNNKQSVEFEEKPTVLPAPDHQGAPKFTFLTPLPKQSEREHIRLQIKVASPTNLLDNFTVLLNETRQPCSLDLQHICDCVLELKAAKNKITISVSNVTGIPTSFEETIFFYPKIKHRALLFVTENYQDSTRWPTIPGLLHAAKDLQHVLEEDYNYSVKLMANPDRKLILEELNALKSTNFNSNDHLFIAIAGHTISDGARGFFVPHDGAGDFKEHPQAYLRYVYLAPRGFVHEKLGKYGKAKEI